MGGLQSPIGEAGSGGYDPARPGRDETVEHQEQRQSLLLRPPFAIASKAVQQGARGVCRSTAEREL
jgi:hypothetical protein